MQLLVPYVKKSPHSKKFRHFVSCCNQGTNMDLINHQVGEGGAFLDGDIWWLREKFQVDMTDVAIYENCETSESHSLRVLLVFDSAWL